LGSGSKYRQIEELIDQYRHPREPLSQSLHCKAGVFQLEQQAPSEFGASLKAIGNQEKLLNLINYFRRISLYSPSPLVEFGFGFNVN
jgi:hypothetical protein